MDLLHGLGGDVGYWFLTHIGFNKEVSVSIDSVILWVTQSNKEGPRPPADPQFLSSASIFKIRHPELGDDQARLHVAGLEGLALAYQNPIRKDDSYRTKSMDLLVEVSNSGRTIELVRKPRSSKE